MWTDLSWLLSKKANFKNKGKGALDRSKIEEVSIVLSLVINFNNHNFKSIYMLYFFKLLPLCFSHMCKYCVFHTMSFLWSAKHFSHQARGNKTYNLRNREQRSAESTSYMFYFLGSALVKERKLFSSIHILNLCSSREPCAVQLNTINQDWTKRLRHNWTYDPRV